MSKLRSNQTGAVSLFVVIFATLLIAVVTISFTRIMVQHQQQANAADLSQSAYDSAKDGVEDSKRLLAYLQNTCKGNSAPGSECATIKSLLGSNSSCNAGLNKIGINTDSTTKEVKIQTSGSGDNKLDQAYTCVKIALKTDSYLGNLIANESKIIPLKAVGNFDTVQIEWFSKNDLNSTINGGNPVLSSTASGTPLLAQASWGENKPPIMRTQFIKFDSVSGFSLSDFDNSPSSRTAFLYPTSNGNSSATLESSRRSSVAAISPTAISCTSNLTSTIYSCKTRVPISNVAQSSGQAYLRLSALYNKAQFKVSLYSGGTLVQFDGVQPEIDSTGRANNLFRRVKSRVELSDTNFPYPEAAVDTTGNFCKSFVITDTDSDYSNSCLPD